MVIKHTFYNHPVLRVFSVLESSSGLTQCKTKQQTILRAKCKSKIDKKYLLLIGFVVVAIVVVAIVVGGVTSFSS